MRMLPLRMRRPIYEDVPSAALALLLPPGELAQLEEPA
jgi:hypothetical protein